MSDLVDLAQAQNERLDAIRLKNCRLQASRPLQDPTGVCLNCGELVSDGLRWCDPECRDDWEHRQRQSSGLAGGGVLLAPFSKGVAA
jgi:hypothetical protein